MGERAWLERCLLVTGLVLLAVFGGVSLYRTTASRLALRDFDRAQAAASGSDSSDALPAVGEADFSLWSRRRVDAYRASQAKNPGAVLAVLRLVRWNVRVPVIEGTDELALNRGAGWIRGTARPGDTGNVGIAAHRDGFFRPLKDAAMGDLIELATIGRTMTYMVDAIEIVSPQDVRVLQQRATPSLTLVTCYPFYFAGDAPRRFILHAALRDDSAGTGNHSTRSP